MRKEGGRARSLASFSRSASTWPLLVGPLDVRSKEPRRKNQRLFRAKKLPRDSDKKELQICDIAERQEARTDGRTDGHAHTREDVVLVVAGGVGWCICISERESPSSKRLAVGHASSVFSGRGEGASSRNLGQLFEGLSMRPR